MTWQTVKLGFLITESRILCENPNPNKRIRVKLNVAGVEKRPLENEIEGATKQFVRKAGQFIYGKQNFHKGAFGIIPKELDGFETSADIPSFDISDDCYAEWIFYYFKIGNRFKELEKIARGVGSKRIHPEQISDIEIPLPDKEEQKELLRRFNKIESQNKQITTELNQQLALVKELRQAYLREAMQGKLVPQDSADEPAEILLAKIKAEKEKLVAEKRIRRDKPLSPIKPEESPFEIPSNWTWCRLGEIFNEIKYGTSKSCDYNAERNSAVLRIPNVSSGVIDDSDLKYTDLTDEEIKDLSLEENDILIIRSNGSKSLVGETALVTSEFVGYAFAGYLIRLRFSSELVNANYLMSATNSQFFRDLIEIPLRTTVGINNINTTEISNFYLPLPPLAEQERIVAKLEKLMKFCDELEANIRRARADADTLLQVALKEALVL